VDPETAPRLKHGCQEEGLTQLGQLLGFDATHPGGQNDPDSVWVASEQLALVWEVKSERSPRERSERGPFNRRPAMTAWVRAHRPLVDAAQVLTILVSDRRRLGEGADVRVGDLRIFGPDDVREIA
jgi:hypothetical protein